VLPVKSLHLPATKFTGYDETETKAKLLWLQYDEKNGVTYLIFEKTPFYPESGGQLGDVGKLLAPDGKEFSVSNTIKEQGVILHTVKSEVRDYPPNELWELRVDPATRESRERAHTATHLLHSALRKVLGEGATQAGSLVGDDYLRFDFYWPRKVSEEELYEIERLVQEWVLEDLKVDTFYTSYKKALELGAIALFGEKYGEEVRVVRIDPVSTELCGGTHLTHTSAIGVFKVLSESSIGSGIRRIEAAVGKRAYDLLNQRSSVISHLKNLLKTREEEVLNKIKSLAEENSLLKKRVTSLLKDKLVSSLTSQSGALRIASTELGVKEARNVISSLFREKAVFLVESLESGKRIVVVGDPEGKAGEIVEHLKKSLGGKGGGKGKFAQYLSNLPLHKIAEEVGKLI
jgi:alanyl-tRNA synthetase